LLTVVIVVLPRRTPASPWRHQALHGAPGDSHAIAQQLVPDLARSIEPGTGLVDALDLRLDLVITTGTRGRLPGSARRRACSW
jgi:hypothetical protein